jgi:hypothetical protein
MAQTELLGQGSDGSRHGSLRRMKFCLIKNKSYLKCVKFYNLLIICELTDKVTEYARKSIAMKYKHL